MTMADPEVLLVHGSCHGAWCWADTIALLRSDGIRARAIDLPDRGGAQPGRPRGLADHARAILDAIDGPVTLVGHSAAGHAISLAAQMAPDRMRRLIYLAAYVPQAGVSLADSRRAAPVQPLVPAIRIDAQRAAFRIDPLLAGDLLYHDCPGDVRRAAIARLCAEPIAPQEEPIAALDRWAGVPRHYIICTRDRAVPPDQQRRMAAGPPACETSELPASHSPFLSMPGRLARRLAAIARAAPSA